MQPQEWSQLLLCSCQPSVPYAVLPFIPESTPDQNISLPSGRKQALGAANMGKTHEFKAYFLLQEFSLILTKGLSGALLSWQGRIESYEAGKMETIAFAGKLSGHIRNI